MQIEFDEQKRARTLSDRGLDFRDAVIIFAGEHYTLQDVRQVYSEPRFLNVGWLNQQMVLMVWTPRDRKRRVISMRKCNERERKIYEEAIHPQ
ncbi:BrnT family toxin [Methylophilus sp. 5]|uniref:BrnT family toxin n=1 Tax=Methylophilus sp. 5 TaxID=1112274 RepID=UPI000491D1C4|nr:BrnT family toxin [Methylophilus sp. 5]